MTEEKQELRGAGDLVAKLTETLGVRPCGGCKKRQEQLNYMIPFHHQGDPPAAGEEK